MIGETTIVPDKLNPNPSKAADPYVMLQLAHEYRRAAHALRLLGQKGKPITYAPARLAAIHGIELYLNTLLVFGGCCPKALKGMHHDLGKRALACRDYGLKLRVKTLDHVADLTVGREYTVSRYEPEMHTGLSQINRVMATLDEIAEKVTGLVMENRACSRRRSPRSPAA